MNESDDKLHLLDFSRERIRTLHYTWIAFFVTFYVWFNMAPLATTMLQSLGWLTKEHVKVLAICNVALTIPARIAIGALADRYGPRKVFSGLMVLMSVPVFFFAFHILSLWFPAVHPLFLFGTGWFGQNSSGPTGCME